MTSTTPKYATNLTTGDQGTTHKLKPRSFNKLFSAPTSLIVRRSLLSIITKYIPPRHCTLLRNRVWFLAITYISFLQNSVLDMFMPLLSLKSVADTLLDVFWSQRRKLEVLLGTWSLCWNINLGLRLKDCEAIMVRSLSTQLWTNFVSGMVSFMKRHYLISLNKMVLLKEL